MISRKIWVTTDRALKAGNEAWGTNKTLAQTKFTEGDSPSFEILDENGKSIVKMDWNSVPDSGIALPFWNNMYMGFPGEAENNPLVAQTKTGGKVYQGKIETSEAPVWGTETSDEWASKLQTYDLKPTGKIYVEDYKVQLGIPQFVSDLPK
jgi:hypothetical protein